MFRVMSPFVTISVPTRDLLVPFNTQSGLSIYTIAKFVNTKHRYISADISKPAGRLPTGEIG